jgi:hypothetical protein
VNGLLVWYAGFVHKDRRGFEDRHCEDVGFASRLRKYDRVIFRVAVTAGPHFPPAELRASTVVDCKKLASTPLYLAFMIRH